MTDNFENLRQGKSQNCLPFYLLRQVEDPWNILIARGQQLSTRNILCKTNFFFFLRYKIRYTFINPFFYNRNLFCTTFIHTVTQSFTRHSLVYMHLGRYCTSAAYIKNNRREQSVTTWPRSVRVPRVMWLHYMYNWNHSYGLLLFWASHRGF